MSEREGSGVARTAQHAVHVLPHAPHVIARFLGPALERVASDADTTQLLVLTPDADTALGVAEVARSISDRSAAPIVPVTSDVRGVRLTRSRVVPALAATPSTVVSLLRSSAVKLEGVRSVVVAWADEIIAAQESEALEVVFAEVPKDASRVVVTDQLTPEVEAFIERHLRRASRMGAVESTEPAIDIPIRYVTTSTGGRRTALRRLLDELDPPSAVIVANDAGGVDEARQTVAALGYVGEETVRVVTEPVSEATALVVLYDLPTTPAELATLATAEVASVIALVTPRQVPALRRLTSGRVEPLDLSQAPAKARARDERLRDAIRAELQTGFPAREIIALEPLLAEFDGLEIAAAALRMFERERAEQRARRVEAERAASRSEDRSSERTERASAPRGQAGFTRVFLGIGERDGIRPGDIVGAITGESGITSDRIGKLEIRESHTIAEVASADAATVVEKMNGVSMRGRRITARIDDRPAPRSREGRGVFGSRGRDRAPGAERRPRRDDDRPRSRSGSRDRTDEGKVPRAVREQEEWTERADRVRNARRPRRDEP